MKSFKREVKLIWHSLKDLFFAYTPSISRKQYKYAFLVHPRNINDVYRKYPLLKFLPSRVLEVFFENVLASRII